MKDTDLPRVEKVVNAAVRRFVSKRAPADPDDMTQEAWQIALSSYGNFNPEKGNLEGYLYRAITLSLGNEVSRWLAVPSIHGRTDLGSALQGRVQVWQDSGTDDAPGLPPALWEMSGPDVPLLKKEAARGRQRWGVRFRRAIDRVLGEFPVRDRKIIERLYGLDGQAPDDPEDQARRLRIPIRRVYKVAARFRSRVYYDLEFNVLDRELEELFP